MLVLPKCGESIAPHDAVSIVVPKKRNFRGLVSLVGFPQRGKPVCVADCPQRALDFGYVDELKGKYGDGEHIHPLPSPSITKPNLIVRHGAVGKPVQ